MCVLARAVRVCMCVLHSEAGMLSVALHRSQGNRKGSAGGMCWALIQHVDQRGAEGQVPQLATEALC